MTLGSLQKLIPFCFTIIILHTLGLYLFTWIKVLTVSYKRWMGYSQPFSKLDFSMWFRNCFKISFTLCIESMFVAVMGILAVSLSCIGLKKIVKYIPRAFSVTRIIVIYLFISNCIKMFWNKHIWSRSG